MNPVQTELQDLLNWKEFTAHHAKCGATFGGDLTGFLAATMDEVRISKSNRVVRSIMSLIEIKDFGLFRKSVLLRELTATIAYPKQRDHSSHTLYNYLLGWYIYRYSGPMKAALEAEFKKRGVGAPGAEWPFESDTSFFGCIWQYVSLLHDIGYMFEGGLPSLAFRGSNEQAAIGARAARDYFNREIWLESNLEVPAVRSKLFAKLGNSLEPPKFDEVETLADIGNQLRFLGENLGALKAPVSESLRALGLGESTHPDFSELSSDAFELWTENYTSFGNTGMAARIQSMRRVFNGLIDEGLPGSGVRLLDHGVCSGLLLLLATTYYYQLYAAAKACTDPSEITKRFSEQGTWSPAFWWAAIIWATSATALHNVQQISAAKQIDDAWPGPLTLAEDPLAYLGVLVDILQEWDRYSVFKSLDSEPIQGTEIELGLAGDKIAIRFICASTLAAKRAKKTRGDLDDALSDWKALVDITP
jgi:hypothetical protein